MVACSVQEFAAPHRLHLTAAGAGKRRAICRFFSLSWVCCLARIGGRWADPLGGRGLASKGGVVMTETGRVTSDMLWRATLIAVLIDAPLLILIARWVSTELFRKLKWYLVGAATIIYTALWGTYGSVYYWESVYKAIFPTWMRWLLPVVYGLLYGVLALVFWRASLLTTRWQVVLFCLLGGLVSLVGHGIGISRGLLRVPLLAEANAVSALVFGVFEFIFYWCAIVGLSVVSRWLGLRLRQTDE
jgi:hypothetical protein